MYECQNIAKRINILHYCGMKYRHNIFNKFANFLNNINNKHNDGVLFKTNNMLID